VQGSAEALRSSLEKLSNKEVRVYVILALPGAINEGDVDLAIASNAIIIGFNVRPTPKAKALAEQERVDIRKYNVIYKVTDAIGRMQKKTVTITVKEGSFEPEIKGITDRYVTSDMVVNRNFALQGVSATVRKKPMPLDDIEVKIIQDTKETYTIVYNVTKNDYTTTETATVYIDDEAPIISGIVYREITLKELQSGKVGIKKLATKNLSVSDNLSKLSVEDVVINVKEKSDYGYYVSYHVKDKAGNKTSITVQFTYFEDAKIEGVRSQEVPLGTEITNKLAMDGISASNKGGDCTDQVEVRIGDKVDGKYKVTYLIPNTDGSYIDIFAFFTEL
jgi:hypothetical protein